MERRILVNKTVESRILGNKTVVNRMWRCRVRRRQVRVRRRQVRVHLERERLRAPERRLFLRIPGRKRRFLKKCYYSLGENDNFPIFTDFYRIFRLSWETSPQIDSTPEASKRSGSGRIEFSSRSTTFLM